MLQTSTLKKFSNSSSSSIAQTELKIYFVPTFDKGKHLNKSEPKTVESKVLNKSLSRNSKSKVLKKSEPKIQ